jgi:hypothetical protein
MKIVERQHRPDLLDGLKRNRTIATAQNPEADDMIIVDADTKKPIVLYTHLGDEHDDIITDLSRRLRLQKAKWTDPKGARRHFSDRLSGISSNTVTFGHTAPDHVKQNYACRLSEVHHYAPTLGDAMTSIIPPMWQLFQKYLPDQAAAHEKIVRDSIHTDWLLHDTPFTSGICNHTSVLPYHCDAGNLSDAWSMMLSVRKNIGGGHLHIPEYDTSLEIADRSVTIFNGQQHLHGVTPFVRLRKDAYRFTLVIYTKQAIRRCGCAKDESRRAAQAATDVTDIAR